MLGSFSGPSPAEDIKSRIDLADFIREYVPLKRMGGNWKGLCPFHNEKSPSFMVSAEKGIWKCFGCGEGGDLFTFLMKKEGLEFPEALRALAQRAGVVLRAHDQKATTQRSRLLDLMKTAADFFHDQLLTSPAAESARQYLHEKRKLQPETIAAFRVGFAPASWDSLSRFILDRGFSESELLLSGLVVQSQRANANQNALPFYDRFRGRVTFPITDIHGTVVGFGARTMSENPDEPKYINTPQTPLYDKGRLLFGLSAAKAAIQERKRAIILEGYMDVLASWQAGVPEAVAPCGTALTEDQVRLLLRYGQDFLLCFDADTAGQAAQERAADTAWQHGAHVYALPPMPEGIKDVDELVRADPEAWKRHVEAPVLFFEHYERAVASTVDPRDFQTRAAALDRLLERLRHAPSPIEREHWISYLAQRWGASASALRERLGIAKILPTSRYPATVSAPRPDAAIDPRVRVGERVLALLLTHPDVARGVFAGFSISWLPSSQQPLYASILETGAAPAADDDPSADQYTLIGENLYSALDAAAVTHEAEQLCARAKELALRHQLDAVAHAMRVHEAGGTDPAPEHLWEDFRSISEQLARL